MNSELSMTDSQYSDRGFNYPGIDEKMCHQTFHLLLPFVMQAFISAFERPRDEIDVTIIRFICNMNSIAQPNISS